MTVVVFDTSIGSSNLGDKIIMDSVDKQVNQLFKDEMILKSCTHMKMGRETYRMLLESDISLIGGTNLLSSNIESNWQWRINFFDSLFVKNLILLGVGWWQYQNRPSIYTSILLKRLLDNSMLHSVRDSYTESMLSEIGIKNVINTGCPTLWDLTPQHCQQIPKGKARNVLLTLTDYNKDRKNDARLIIILKKYYDNIYFWPQGLRDLKYLTSLEEISNANINLVSPSLNALNEILGSQSMSLDYVGTRLHAGIRALQKRRRSIIIAIDNRAIEKSRDFDLNVVSRDDYSFLESKLESEFSTEIRLPWEAINIWKSQFS